MTEWEMYAHRYDSGRYHTVGSERYVRLHGLSEKIIPVRVTEVDPGDESGNAWGWMGAAYLHYEADTEPQMIWCTRAQFEMCFPYGSKAEVERGKGRVVRLRITDADQPGSRDELGDYIAEAIESDPEFAAAYRRREDKPQEV